MIYFFCGISKEEKEKKHISEVSTKSFFFIFLSFPITTTIVQEQKETYLRPGLIENNIKGLATRVLEE